MGPNGTPFCSAITDDEFFGDRVNLSAKMLCTCPDPTSYYVISRGAGTRSSHAPVDFCQVRNVLVAAAYTNNLSRRVMIIVGSSDWVILATEKGTRIPGRSVLIKVCNHQIAISSVWSARNGSRIFAQHPCWHVTA